MSSANAMTLNSLELERLFLAIVLLLCAAHTLGYLFQQFRLPRVIGEIAGGVIFGPSLLGYYFPDAHAWLFHASETQPKLLSMLSWFGLVLLMFVSGFELQKSVSKDDRRVILAILLGGTLVPFLAGWLAPTFFNLSSLVGVKGDGVPFKLILGIAVAVTSIPVISKIFMDLNILHTRFAKIVMAAATVEDVLLWVVLAVATGIVRSNDVALVPILSTVMLSLAFFTVGLLVMPRLVKAGNASRANVLIRSSVSGYALFICFFFAAIAGLLAVNVVFGALVAGIIVGLASDEQCETAKKHIKEVSLGFFVPLYFAIVGLKLDLVHYFAILPFVGFLLFATLVKVSGTLAGVKLLRYDWPSSFNLAVAMNARGGPGIVLATVAFEMGIISESFFVILVLVAIITSLLAGTWLSCALSKQSDLLQHAGAGMVRAEAAVRPASEQHTEGQAQHTKRPVLSYTRRRRGWAAARARGRGPDGAGLNPNRPSRP